MMAIDAPTLLRQLNDLGAIGLDGSGGRTRLAASDADQAGRDMLVTLMHELALTVSIDQIGNIIGLWPGHDSALAPIMLGSHIDTVIHAGMYDGCYGVLAGLAVIRALKQAGVQPRRGIAVVAFTNEEGVRYQPDMMGSLVYAGGMSVTDALNVIGTIALAGVGFGDLSVDFLSMISGRTITGVMEGDSVPNEFIPYLARLNADGKFPYHELITEFPLDQINEAEKASASGAVIKPVLVMPD